MTTSGESAPRRVRRSRTDRDDGPVLPETTRDERDPGWGDERDGRRDEDWYRRERPPHHGD